MAAEIEPTVTRAAPTWEHTYSWRHRGRTDIHGHRETKVAARYSSNEEPDTSKRPNEITIHHTHGQDRTSETVRMPRAEAQMLIEQLTAALAWDGA